jgi:hypothetical protein
LKIAFLFQELRNLESPGSKGQNVEAAVFVSRQYSLYMRFTSDGTDSGGALIDDAKGPLLLEALPDHELVALFKDMQWEGHLGQEHDIERKERDLLSVAVVVCSFH